jgi:hypothetical protein
MTKVSCWVVVDDNDKPYHSSTEQTVADRWKAKGYRVVFMTGELPEPKKKVKLAPALCGGAADGKHYFYLTRDLFGDELTAKQLCEEFVCWPAPQPDEDGFIEVEEPASPRSQEVEG